MENHTPKMHRHPMGLITAEGDFVVTNEGRNSWAVRPILEGEVDFYDEWNQTSYAHITKQEAVAHIAYMRNKKN
jgi:hypothetical protein